jgi:hypothetical protein
VSDRVADILDGFTDLASRFSEAFFNIAAGLVRVAFGFEIAIVDRSADYFLSFTLSLIEFAFNFVSIWQSHLNLLIP